jgi:dihydroorotate dehydrogenase (NAD+) catalytic subunit
MDLASRLTEKTKKAAKDKPLWVKLPPLVSDIASLAKKIEEAGAQALSLINSLPGLAIDLDSQKPLLANQTGGLSGAPIKPLALRQVHLVSQAVKIPVVGMGGIFTARDALEFIIAGATAVEIGTAILIDPRCPLTIIKDLETWLREKDLKDLGPIRNSLIGRKTNSPLK